MIQALTSSQPTAAWSLSLPDGHHQVELEHGATTGKRVVKVDDKEVIRRDWMFKLVGKESFKLPGKQSCEIKITSDTGFTFKYQLFVDGKPHAQFAAQRSQIQRTWLVASMRLGASARNPSAAPCRVVLERDSLDVWCNGRKVDEGDTVRDFTDGGATISFSLTDGRPAELRGEVHGKQLDHRLFVDNVEIEPENLAECSCNDSKQSKKK